MPPKYLCFRVIRQLSQLLALSLVTLLMMCTPCEESLEKIENLLTGPYDRSYYVVRPTIVKIWRKGETGYLAWTDLDEGYTVHHMYELGFLSEKKTLWEGGYLGYEIYEVPRGLLAWYLDQGPRYTQEFGGVHQLDRTEFSYVVNLNWPKVPPNVGVKPLATEPVPGFKYIRTFHVRSDLVLLAFADVFEDSKTGARTVDEISVFLGPYEGFTDHK